MPKTEPQPSIQGKSRVGGGEERRNDERVGDAVRCASITVSAFAKRMSREANQIKQWKDPFLDGVTDAFDDKPKMPKEPEIDVKSLHEKIGQLTLESDFLGDALAKTSLLGSAEK